MSDANDRKGDPMSTRTTYRVGGMTCDGCARAVTAAIHEAAPSLEDVRVDVGAGTVTVTGTAPATAIEGAVDGAGFDFKGVAG